MRLQVVFVFSNTPTNLQINFCINLRYDYSFNEMTGPDTTIVRGHGLDSLFRLPFFAYQPIVENVVRCPFARYVISPNCRPQNAVNV